MLNELYSTTLLDAAGNIPAARRLEAPDATATRTSRVCGSTVTVDIAVEDQIISDFAMEVTACALGQASASILAAHIKGAPVAELFRVRNEMRAMLKERGAAPSGERWQDLAKLQPIAEYPARHASTLLVFEAVVDCLEQLRLRPEIG